MQSQHSGPARGFTLVEILIVVVILGILAAIVVPQFASASEESKRAAFVTELRTLMDAADYYNAKEGELVPDGSSGVCPPEFDPYYDADDFEAGTPIGGVWDLERDDNGVRSAVGVHFMNAADARDDAYMLLVDEMFDDGDLSSGLFRKLAGDRYYAVLAD